MKINWNQPDPQKTLSRTDIETLQRKIARKASGNCFSLYLLPNEIAWATANIENGIVKAFPDYPTDDDTQLTFIARNEELADKAFSKI